MQNIYIICIPEEIFRTAEYKLFHCKRKKGNFERVQSIASRIETKKIQIKLAT